MSDILVWQAVLPIVIVASYGLLVLVLSPILRDNRRTLAAVACLGLAVAGWAGLKQWGMELDTAFNMVRVDRLSTFFGLLFVAVGILTVLISMRYLERQNANHGEHYALILFAVTGMMTMAASDNLLVIFVGLELLSIPLYVLAGLTRSRIRSIESSLKYFLLGAFSTGFILYGLAFLYGATGTLRLPELLAGPVSRQALLIGAALVLVGFAFKIAAVPFHFWAPDVYQGAPTSVTGFMAAGTKAAAFAALLRVLGTGLTSPPLVGIWKTAMMDLSLLTMTVGNLVALTQTNIKRLLAWSSIAHAGYLLIAIVTLGSGLQTGGGSSRDAVQALSFYLVSYALMTLGAFAVAALIGPEGSPGGPGGGEEREGQEGYAIAAWSGLARRRPALAAMMTVFLLSLAGLPPTGGFVAKFYLFRGALQAGLWTLTVVGVLNSVLSAYYYLKVIVAMYMSEPQPISAVPAQAGLSSGVALAISVAGTLYLGLFPGRLLEIASGLFGAMR